MGDWDPDFPCKPQLQQYADIKPEAVKPLVWARNQVQNSQDYESKLRL